MLLPRVSVHIFSQENGRPAGEQVYAVCRKNCPADSNDSPLFQCAYHQYKRKPAGLAFCFIRIGPYRGSSYLET
jgi:hypothetical protein